MSSPDPRHAYVRFYLQVLAQLEEVATTLARTAGETRDAVQPFRDVIDTVSEPDLAGALAPRESMSGLQRLWRPQDPALLTGIVDVYEVVGRFTFQGEDDANLEALQTVVRAGSDEVERQRRALAALARAPAAATRHAEGLSQQEIAAAEAQLTARLKPFEPVAEQLREQCSKVLDAVRIVPRPDLSRLQDADLLYQEYVKRMQSLYTAALPYLRRALSELCTVAEVEVPASWPDTLPFAASLPAELLTSPPAESPAMASLRAQSQQVATQEGSYERALEEITGQQRKLEAEKVDALRREAEALGALEAAKNLVRWAEKSEEVLTLQRGIDASLARKQEQVGRVGQLYVQHQQLSAQVASAQQEIARRQQEVAQAAASLEKLRGDEPAIFGKDDWRRRVEELQFELSERTTALGRRESDFAQLQNELAVVAGRVQAEQAQIALIDQSVDADRKRADAARAASVPIEQLLGPGKPARAPTLAQAEETLAAMGNALGDLRARAEEIAARMRRNQEEADRITMQRRQLGSERQKLAAALEQAARDAAVAQKEAIAELAARRKTGFNQYVGQVLAPLEESLSQVDRIFIEPARRVLQQRSMGDAPRAGSLRAQAEGLAAALAQLSPRVEPVIAAQAEVLRRVQSDFCDRVRDAVRSAWAA